MPQLAPSDRRAIEEARVRLASMPEMRTTDTDRLDLVIEIEQLRGIARTLLGVIDDTHGR